MSDVVLSARDVGARYRRREVFHDLWFELCANQALGVIGPNGAGKTTLLRVIAGLLPASAGRCRVRVSNRAVRRRASTSPISPATSRFLAPFAPATGAAWRPATC